MKAETIEDLTKSSKFKPFTIVTDNGERIEVNHPDFIFISPKKTTVVVFDKRDHIQIIDLDHITSVTMKSKAA